MSDDPQAEPVDWFAALTASPGDMAQLPNNGARYHAGAQIINHLNRVLGPRNWDFRVIAVGEESDSDECWAFVEILARIDNKIVTKQDYGSQAYKRARSTGQYVSKWDDRKAAITDGLKRCARLLGVGIDAWENERAPSWRPAESIVDDGPPIPSPVARRSPGLPEPPEVPTCAICGDLLQEFKDRTGRVWTVEELAQVSQGRFGMVLCEQDSRNEEEKRKRARESRASR